MWQRGVGSVYEPTPRCPFLRRLFLIQLRLVGQSFGGKLHPKADAASEGKPGLILPELRLVAGQLLQQRSGLRMQGRQVRPVLFDEAGRGQRASDQSAEPGGDRPGGRLPDLHSDEALPHGLCGRRAAGGPSEDDEGLLQRLRRPAGPDRRRMAGAPLYPLRDSQPIPTAARCGCPGPGTALLLERVLCRRHGGPSLWPELGQLRRRSHCRPLRHRPLPPGDPPPLRRKGNEWRPRHDQIGQRKIVLHITGHRPRNQPPQIQLLCVRLLQYIP